MFKNTVIRKANLALSLLYLGNFSTYGFAEENGEDFSQIVVGYEKVIQKSKGSEVRLVVETFYPETTEQLQVAEKYIESLATSALKDNNELNIEYITANYEENATLSVTALNKASKDVIHKTKKELLATHHVKNSDLSSEEIGARYGFKDLVDNPRFFATEVSVPTIDLAEPESEGLGLSPESAKDKKINRILTVVRAVGSLGINAFMVYNALGSDMFSPLVVPAILFYPAAETLLQSFAGRYEGLLRRIPSVSGRLAVQTAFSFAAISIHVALLSSVGVTHFAWLAVAATAFKDATATQPWWEMVIRGKPKFLKGQYVSFGLGVIGMTGLLFDSTGYNFGTYILYALGGTGAVIWLKNGAMSTLKKDALKAAKFFKETSRKAIKNYKKSCAALRLGSFGSYLPP